MKRGARCLLGSVVLLGRLRRARREKGGATDYKVRRPPSPGAVGGGRGRAHRAFKLYSGYRQSGNPRFASPAKRELSDWSGKTRDESLGLHLGHVTGHVTRPQLLENLTHRGPFQPSPPQAPVFPGGLSGLRACPWKAETAAGTVSWRRGRILAAMSGGFELQPRDGGPRVALAPGETVIGRGPLLGVSVATARPDPRAVQRTIPLASEALSPPEPIPHPAGHVRILKVWGQHVFSLNLTQLTHVSLMLPLKSTDLCYHRYHPIWWSANCGPGSKCSLAVWGWALRF